MRVCIMKASTAGKQRRATFFRCPPACAISSLLQKHHIATANALSHSSREPKTAAKGPGKNQARETHLQGVHEQRCRARARCKLPWYSVPLRGAVLAQSEATDPEAHEIEPKIPCSRRRIERVINIYVKPRS